MALRRDCDTGRDRRWPRPVNLTAQCNLREVTRKPAICPPVGFSRWCLPMSKTVGLLLYLIAQPIEHCSKLAQFRQDRRGPF